MKADLLQWHVAAAEAIAALESVRERLEMNDLDGNCRFFRAASRDKAKAAIRADFPDAKFYR